MKPGLKKYLKEAKCCYCKQDLTKWREENTDNRFCATIEHKIPRSKNGSNDLENLLIACGRCNQLRGDIDYEIFEHFARTVIRHYPNTPTIILRRALRQFIESLAMIAIRNRREANRASSHALLLIANDIENWNYEILK